MATTPPFKYQPMFEHGEDKTEYYLLTKDYVSVSEFEGKPILKIEKEGLTAMANTAFRDVSFMLRRSHNEQVAKILRDPEASDNDKYVALTFLRNAEVASKGVLPFCQDTGTAIVCFADGTVGTVGESNILGNYVTVNHEGGFSTLYAHCSAITASAGQSVKKGDAIAKVGSTGNATGSHLHFEVHDGEEYLNPVYYAVP